MSKSKKYLAGLLVVLVACGVGGYWLYGRQHADGPAILTLPPAQALAFVAAPGWPQAWADLQRSKFFQHVSSAAFWQQALGPEGYRHLLAEKQRLEEDLGRPLTPSTVNLLLDREFGVALVPGQEHVVDVIAYVRVSSTEKLAEGLNRIFSGTPQDIERQTQSVDGIDIVTLRPKGMPTSVSYAFLGTLAVLSTDRAWVIDAVKARHGTAADRLHTTAAFQAMPVKAAEPLLAYGYYDGEGLQALARAGLPRTTLAPSAATLHMLQTTAKVTLHARRGSDGIMVDSMAWYPRAGATQVFRQAERDGAILPFRGVPAETFYLTHIDLLNLQGVWQWLKQLTAMGHQEVWQQMLAGFRRRTGVDLERDVLPVLSGTGGLGITAPFGSPAGSPTSLPGVFLTLGLTDEARAQQLIEAIVAHAAGPFWVESLQRQAHDGHTIYYLGNPLLFVNPGYVISRGQLIVGSDVGLLRHMLDAATGKTQTLTNTTAYQDIRKHFRSQGGSITFIDVSTSVENVRDTWLRLGGVIRLLTRLNSGTSAVASMPGDPWKLLEILRPIRYVGVASEAEAQGLRTEAFVAIRDLP
jgi:hypothetical protein